MREKDQSRENVKTKEQDTLVEELKYRCHWRNPKSGQKCLFMAKLKTNIQVHLRSHTGERPYRCDICFKKFSVLGNRNDHLRRHQGYRPYQCPVRDCNKAYYRRYQMINHVNARKHRDLVDKSLVMEQVSKQDEKRRSLWKLVKGQNITPIVNINQVSSELIKKQC